MSTAYRSQAPGLRGQTSSRQTYWRVTCVMTRGMLLHCLSSLYNGEIRRMGAGTGVQG